MSPTIKPNFFIVGAAKCGTTSMYEHLRAHPQVFMPTGSIPGNSVRTAKEPHYFGRDLNIVDGWAVRDLDTYLSLFASANGAKRVGEGSVWSILSSTAAEEIKAFDPQAKIIIMLRDPVDMMYSIHGQLIRGGVEDLLDFELALDAEDDRRQGRRVPHNANFPMGLWYRFRATLSPQVQLYFDVFGRDAVRVILFDDFIRDTAKVYRQTLEFLDIAPDFQPVFDAKKPGLEDQKLGYSKDLHVATASQVMGPPVCASVLTPPSWQHHEVDPHAAQPTEDDGPSPTTATHRGVQA